MMNLMEPAAWWGEGRQNKIVYWSWYLRIPKNNTHRSSKEHYHCIFRRDQRHENLIDVKSLMAMHGAEPIGRASGGTWFPYCSEQLNSLTDKGLGGNEKLPPHRFYTVGIVQIICQTTTQLPQQTSSPWCSLCPTYGVDSNSMNRPNPMSGRPSEGVGQGLLCGVLYKPIK